MRIIVDVMGGDKSPEETVKGAIWAAKDSNASLILVGNRNDIERIARENEYDPRRLDIVHTESVIEMTDDPLSVVRAKQDSSMAVGLRMLSEGHGDAFVSCGNTGALFTGATLIVRKVKGISRAGIGTVIPFQTPVLLLDTGANVTVTEENLEHFAVIGSAYMGGMYGIQRPRVGLLNNGAEATKGTELYRAAYQRLSDNPDINFVGNIESNVLPFNCCDVIVADGFTGNVFLKGVEGVGKLIFGKMKEVLNSTPTSKLAALALRNQLKGLKQDFDASEHGGSPILGISKPVIKAHGSTDARGFQNAIRQAVRYAGSDAIYTIAESAQNELARKKAAKEAEHAAAPEEAH